MPRPPSSFRSTARWYHIPIILFAPPLALLAALVTAPFSLTRAAQAHRRALRDLADLTARARRITIAEIDAHLASAPGTLIRETRSLRTFALWWVPQTITPPSTNHDWSTDPRATLVLTASTQPELATLSTTLATNRARYPTLTIHHTVKGGEPPPSPHRALAVGRSPRRLGGGG